MRAHRPARMCLRVTFLAVVIHHQRACRYEVAGGSARQRREEILQPAARSLDTPTARVLQLEIEGAEREHCGECRDDGPRAPVDALARETVQHEQPEDEK